MYVYGSKGRRLELTLSKLVNISTMAESRVVTDQGKNIGRLTWVGVVCES